MTRLRFNNKKVEARKKVAMCPKCFKTFMTRSGYESHKLTCWGVENGTLKEFTKYMVEKTEDGFKITPPQQG